MRLFVMICISRIVLASSESWCVIVLLNLLVKLDNSLYSVVLLNTKKFMLNQLLQQQSYLQMLKSSACAIL